MRITQKNQNLLRGNWKREKPYPTRQHMNTSITETRTETQIVFINEVL